MNPTVSILCAARNSVYKTIPGCDVYDASRDARTFRGGLPVIGHPPCRCYSAFCSHQAKPIDREAEMALGPFCVEMVRQNGGVIEQPAHSRLWDACKLPKPGIRPNNGHGFSLELPQFWFGDSREKNTWLWFFGIDATDLPKMPFRLKPDGHPDRRIWQLMSSKNKRESTPRPFAEWLIECALKAKVVL